MIELTNKTSLKVDENILEMIYSTLSKKDIELLVVNEEEMLSINKEQRGLDYSTDVLSFPYDDMPFVPLGSIVISQAHVLSKAKELGHSEMNELTLLFIHGLLHLLGFDHEIDNGEMREKEKELIEKFNLPKSLIVRTQG